MEGSLTPLAQIAGTLSVPQGVIAPTLQDKTVDITATETAQTETVEKDQGYDGLNEVTINVSAIPSDFVGSGITRRDETDLTASGATVTVPAGYYEEAETKSIESGAAATPATSITANPSISLNTETGLITASASASQNVTPNVTPGYVDSGTAGAISVSGSSTSQLSVQAGSTITPTESQQTAVAAGKYTIGAVNIGAISSSYVGSGITRRDSDDLTASGATVTAPAGYYGESASKSVASGTEGTPTATKGSVSNHSVSVTPSVTNTAGYISGGTKTGAAVTVSASELVSGSQTIDENDTYDVTNLSSVTVNVPTGSTINNQDKSVTPTESAQSVTYDSGYTGLGTVSVGAISSSYVGTGITRRDSDDLSASGATVSAPAGYYGSQATKSVASMTLPSSVSSSGSGTFKAAIKSIQTDDPSSGIRYLNIPTGYNGTAQHYQLEPFTVENLTVTGAGTFSPGDYDDDAFGTVSVPAGTANTPTATKGTVSNHAITVTPSVTNSAGWVSSETLTGTAVTVQASELDSGTKSITANGTNQDVVGYAAVDVAVPNSYSAGDEGKVVDDGALVSQTAHADVTPTTSDQTIDTTTNNSIKVKGDADLVAGNIKKDVEIFGVTGSYEGSGGGGLLLIDALNGNVSGDVTLNVTNPLPAGNTNGWWGYAAYSHLLARSSIANLTINGMVNVPAFVARNNSSLKTVSFPDATVIGGGNSFENCTNLETASFPSLTDVYYNYTQNGNYMFNSCTKLTSVNVRKVNRVAQYMFRSCNTLSHLEFEQITYVSQNGFSMAPALAVLIIRSTSVPTLQNINAFNDTPFASNKAGGTLYVPNDLKSSYQSASNWSTILGYPNNSIVAIEGSQYENYHDDGTPVT